MITIIIIVIIIINTDTRSFTDEYLPAWKDAEEMGILFNALKKTSLTDPNSYRHDRPAIKADKLIGSKQGSSSAQTLACGVCSDIYRVTNWPESAWPVVFKEKEGLCFFIIYSSITNLTYYNKDERNLSGTGSVHHVLSLQAPKARS